MSNDDAFLNNHLEYPCINDDVSINNEDYHGINEIDSVEDEDEDYNSNIEFIEIENSQYDSYEVSKEISNNIYNHFREISNLQFLKESQSEDNISEFNLQYVNQYSEYNNMEFNEEINSMEIDEKILSDLDNKNINNIDDSEYDDLELELIIENQLELQDPYKELLMEIEELHEKIDVDIDIDINKEEELEELKEKLDIGEVVVLPEILDNLKLSVNEIKQNKIEDYNNSTIKSVKFNLELDSYLDQEFNEKIKLDIYLEKELVLPLDLYIENNISNKNNLSYENENYKQQIFKEPNEEPILFINEIKNESYIEKSTELCSNNSETDLESTYENLQITRLNNHLTNEVIDFDWKQYVQNYNDLKENGVNSQEKAWNHWINNGKFEGRTYLPFINNKKKKIHKSIDMDKISLDFDWKQYVENYKDLEDTGIDTLEKAWKHWTYHGQFEGRTYFPFIKKSINTISSDFDWKQYVENYKDLEDTGIDTLEKAWKHWIEYGENEGRTYLYKVSYKFNWKQYILNYKDLQESGLNTFEQALYHWENYGEMEGRTYMNIENENDKVEVNKNIFDWEQYILNYTDLQESGLNTFEQAWYHWINYGEIEGRTFLNLNNECNKEENTNDIFNWKQYILNYKDLQDSGLGTFEQAWYHWINYGKLEGRTYRNLVLKDEEDEDEDKDKDNDDDEDEVKEFDWKQYVENYKDLQEININSYEKAWNHWIHHGKIEGRKYHNFYEEEIKQGYNNKIDLISYNNINIKFKPKYDRYGTHYYGWKGVINNFIQWFCELNKNKTFKYNIFFDEWIEKLLLWGNKIINENYLKEIKNNYYKVITFIHNPPFTQINDEKYRNKIKKEVIINNNSHFNENLYNEIEKNGIFDNLVYVYVLSNQHKEFMYNKFPKLQNKLLSVHHPIDLQTEESQYFDIDDFINNKKIYNIGWWLRNFKTFIDFSIPKNFKKHILVKNDFLLPFNNDIVSNNDMSDIIIVNEVTNEEYSSIFKNSVVFADIVDCIANNTILECIKFNTPIIVRRNKSAEEYLGVNYPLFFSDYSELVYLKEESFLLDLIFESHFYLKNMNKQHIELNSFNNKINYDLSKLIENNDKPHLTWCCFIDQDNRMFLEKIIENFIQQENCSQIKLLFLINNYQEKFEFEKNIQKYMEVYENISYIFLNEPYYINDNKKIYLSYKNTSSLYITIVNPKNIYENKYSLISLQKLDLQPTCDITVSSYNLISKLNGILKQSFPINILMNKNFVNKNICTNSGIIWRRDLYPLIEPLDDLEEINENTYNFWVKCVENNMNMICVSELPLLTIDE